jgi:hypothetical protein
VAAAEAAATVMSHTLRQKIILLVCLSTTLLFISFQVRNTAATMTSKELLALWLQPRISKLATEDIIEIVDGIGGPSNMTLPPGTGEILISDGGISLSSGSNISLCSNLTMQILAY